MTRIALMSAVLFLTAAPMAQAAIDDAECKLQIEVVMALAEARKGGAKLQAATKDVSTSLSGEADKYAPIVPDIAAWIYTLPADQLSGDLGQSWQDQVCAAG
ncbi:hypothetical protein ACOXXX_04315 [Thalassococcus sp. BH17M4-6]|uniref:hypothetical protein n=1 Tax=Thalassococcus sp. BH17M4-6 TaxID=3413148 RepID=UPI003BC60D57